MAKSEDINNHENNENFVHEMSSVSLEDKVDEEYLTKDRMLQRLSQTDAFFKHQQRGEPDLTAYEKYKIADEILSKNRKLFLERFWKYLGIEDLSYFEKFSNEYEVDFYLKQICKSKSSDFDRNRAKNRRYKAMQMLLDKGEYFSEDEMKYRDPYLYEQLVGQYLTDDEINDKVDKTDLRFSTVLFKHMDILQENELYHNQKDKEESQMEEEEESEDGETEMEDEDSSVRKTIPDGQKAALKQEFLTIMQERFMSGQDEEFNYSEVDNNTEYDDLDILQKDEEEKYFDDDDESNSFVENCVMDYNMPGDDSKFTTEVLNSNSKIEMDYVLKERDNHRKIPDKEIKNGTDQTI